MFLIETVSFNRDSSRKGRPLSRLNELGIPVPGVLHGHSGENAKKIQGYIQRRYEQDKAGERPALLHF